MVMIVLTSWTLVLSEFIGHILEVAVNSGAFLVLKTYIGERERPPSNEPKRFRLNIPIE